MFDSSFRRPSAGDPEYVLENAAFAALAHPPSRRILELSRVQERDIEELAMHVGGPVEITQAWVDDLIELGMLRKFGGAQPQLYKLDPVGWERVRAWMAMFEPEALKRLRSSRKEP